jgi:hypothetical protein
MTKEVKQLIMVGVLVVVLIFAMLNTFKKKPSKKTTPGNKPVAGSTTGVKATLPAVNIPADNKTIASQKQRLDLGWGRDPFNTAIDKEFQFSDLKLKGISFGDDQQGYAFVNNDIVKKGDRVGDYEVVNIEKDKVLLRKAGQSFYLTFPQD